MGKAPRLNVALVGTPNTGKTSAYNALTGMNQRVGNFPGVTVERATAEIQLDRHRRARLTDLPGTYTLYPSADDERVACEVLRDPNHPDHPDLLVVVVDATQPHRGLVLATQAMDLGIPMLIAMNMVDMLAHDGIRADWGLLARNLGVPVVPISARLGQGLADLRRALAQHPCTPPPAVMAIPQGFAAAVEALRQALPQGTGGKAAPYRAYQALMRPEEFPPKVAAQARAWQQQVGVQEPNKLIANELLVRYDRVQGYMQGVLGGAHSPAQRRTTRLDGVLLHPVGGYVVFVAVLLLMFQAIFSWAEWPMTVIETAFNGAGGLLARLLPRAWYSDMLVDGLWAGLGGIVVFVPQIALMSLFIALLEETGYMSRIIFLMDRLMRPFGLSGRAMVPLVGGLACAIPAIMATRSIANRRERLIAIMVTPLMSCSARLPVYGLLVGLFVQPTPVLGGFITLQSITMLGVYVLGFCMALAAALVFKAVLPGGGAGHFIAELPPYRRPRWRNVALVIYQKSRAFVAEAGKVIVVISLLLWVLQHTAPAGVFEAIEAQHEAAFGNPEADEAALEAQIRAAKLEASYAGLLGQAMSPVIRPLGFDWKIGIALVTSFAAREVFVGTMATLYGTDAGADDNRLLRQRMAAATHPDTGAPVYTPAVALALIVFYAFAMQCMSTLAIVRRETGGWKWAGIMVVYLTALAYAAAWVAYQLAGLWA